jgi:Cdc6-like AAA superfamily ATPase
MAETGINSGNNSQNLDETRNKLPKSFTPHQPIAIPDFLAGRIELLYRLTDAINTEGLHVMIYGDRGTGKTSIARVIAYLVQEPNNSQGRRCALVSCTPDDTYTSVWRKIGQEILLSQRQLGFRLQETREIIGRLDLDSSILTPTDARIFLESTDNPLVIIIDEFDRMRDHNARALLADTIKYFADNRVRSTLLLVGVGQTLSDLLREHPSVARNVAQIKVEPMAIEELAQIIQKGYKSCGMIFQPGLDNEIAKLSQGYPHYTHLLGLWSGRKAIENKRLEVTFDDLSQAIPNALTNAVGGLQEQYERAIYSIQKVNLFRQILLACALARKDSLGRFGVGALQEPLKLITGVDYSTAAYQMHLAKFCEVERGSVLQREGTPKMYRWRFLNPQLVPYVVLQGVSQNMIQSSRIPRHRD